MGTIIASYVHLSATQVIPAQVAGSDQRSDLGDWMSQQVAKSTKHAQTQQDDRYTAIRFNMEIKLTDISMQKSREHDYLFFIIRNACLGTQRCALI